MPMNRNSFRATIAMAMMPMAVTAMANPDPNDWQSVTAQAEGQTVYWNAWGGEARTNAYIEWVAQQVDELYGIDLVHVKLGDTSESVSRVLAEKQAGNDDAGSVDMIWINGENFAAMKSSDLLFGPWADSLPHYPLTDPDNTPAVRYDWTIPVDGLESPWSSSQVVFYYDTALVEDLPHNMPELLDWAKQHPGEFTYPQVPNFLGNAFITQALLELVDNTDLFYEPMQTDDFDQATAPLWAYLDELHPQLWRSGRAFPSNSADLRGLMGDSEIGIALSFSATEASGAIANYELPETVRSYVHDSGMIGNMSFMAIPYNAEHKAGAMVVANYLMSPEAQAEKHDPEVWGSGTVLAMEQLTDEERALFDGIDLGIATLPPSELGEVLGQPHPSWVDALADAWQQRYVN
ncbi:ABC transporter substrate-binding protein [Halomonas sp. FME1]|uniref:ABC transporter substrate-binding protein n=2 Tax=Halomonas TaxID=2745 RepID=A0ABR9EZX6_9GAMM|nr:ABC transporter substrate-binding protein [Halomonas sp. JB37]MBE0399765.1 ABC transporter substrate-binding protein [Halomonas casei]PCC23672.1 ABC transporter substrate-binding protein [Halomonas sp. JB37]